MKYSEKVKVLMRSMAETDSTREAVLKAQERGVRMDCEEDAKAFQEATESLMELAKLTII